MRLAGEIVGTRKAAIDILQLCFEAKAWKTLNDQIVVLSKRRGQLKQVLAESRCVLCQLSRGLGFWFALNVWLIFLPFRMEIVYCLFECLVTLDAILMEELFRQPMEWIIVLDSQLLIQKQFRVYVDLVFYLVAV